MKILEKWSQKYFGDVVAKECLGKCVKVCLSDIQVTESQCIMETRSGEYGFLNCSLKVKKVRVKRLGVSAWECNLSLKCLTCPAVIL